MSKVPHICPLRVGVEELALYFSKLAAANSILQSRGIARELLAYDHWMAIHSARCEQCNFAYREAARKISERLKNAS